MCIVLVFALKPVKQKGTLAFRHLYKHSHAQIRLDKIFTRCRLHTCRMTAYLPIQRGFQLTNKCSLDWHAIKIYGFMSWNIHALILTWFFSLFCNFVRERTEVLSPPYTRYSIIARRLSCLDVVVWNRANSRKHSYNLSLGSVLAVLYAVL